MYDYEDSNINLDTIISVPVKKAVTFMADLYVLKVKHIH